MIEWILDRSDTMIAAVYSYSTPLWIIERCGWAWLETLLSITLFILNNRPPTPLTTTQLTTSLTDFLLKSIFFIFFRSRWTFEPNKTNNRNLKVVRFYLQYFSQYKESLFPTGNTKHLLTFDVESREFKINQLAPCHNCSTHHNFKI